MRYRRSGRFPRWSRALSEARFSASAFVLLLPVLADGRPLPAGGQALPEGAQPAPAEQPAEEREAPAVASFEVSAPPLVLTGVPFEIEIVPRGADGAPLREYAGRPSLSWSDSGAVHAVGASEPPIRTEQGALVVSGIARSVSGASRLTVSDGAVSSSASIRAIPGFLSVVPPLAAMLLAVLLRQVVIALVAGVWIGATIVSGFDPLTGFFEVGSRFVIDAVTDRDRAHIIVFSMMFGGLAGILSKGGGARGFAQLITRYAKTARRGQVSAMLMALVVFFDDYANVIIRGNLMRPITDGLRVSREKLAFLTDTGAASVASTVIVSTWIGYEVGLIDQGLDLIDYPEDGYSVFLRTIPYRFYPIFSFVLALAVGLLGRDFGPMRAAEQRAARRNEPLRPGSEPATEALDEEPGLEGVRALWINGLLPIAAVLVTAGVSIWWTGAAALRAAGETEYGLRQIVTNSDSYVSLLWASSAGCAVGLLVAVSRRLLGLGAAINAWISGLKSMVLAILILVLAWCIGDVTAELQAAQYLVLVFQNVLSPALLPTLTFVVAGVMAFATGTSWATMAVLMPLVIPLSSALSANAGLAPAAADPILMGVVGAVLAGAVFGDHCSPISDTTVLSSMASACDHLDHVKTQLPYALSAAAIAIVLGILPTSFGVPPWIALLGGTIGAVAVVRVLGARIDARERGGGPSDRAPDRRTAAA